MTESDTTTPWQSLSALADGEVDAAAAASLAAAWRDDAMLRRRWHAYHLIGDALRSEELAAGAGDAAFLRRLRERLDREPVVLAPVAIERPSEVAAAVNSAIEDLSEDLRQAITLREIEGLSYEEIASVMNCPIGTVRSRIFRAREAIAERLRPLLDTRSGERW